jgi:hypothetical protein
MPFKKGDPRPAGAGRVAGVPNKATQDIKEACRKVAPEMVAELVKIARTAESEPARVSAIKEILDRGYGKSTIIADITMKRDVRELTDDELIAIASRAGIDQAQAGEEKPGAIH